jgi:hypothetical protein
MHPPPPPPPPRKKENLPSRVYWWAIFISQDFMITNEWECSVRVMAHWLPYRRPIYDQHQWAITGHPMCTPWCKEKVHSHCSQVKGKLQLLCRPRFLEEIQRGWDPLEKPNTHFIPARYHKKKTHGKKSFSAHAFTTEGVLKRSTQASSGGSHLFWDSSKFHSLGFGLSLKKVKVPPM